MYCWVTLVKVIVYLKPWEHRHFVLKPWLYYRVQFFEFWHAISFSQAKKVKQISKAKIIITVSGAVFQVSTFPSKKVKQIPKANSYIWREHTLFCFKSRGNCPVFVDFCELHWLTGSRRDSAMNCNNRDVRKSVANQYTEWNAVATVSNISCLLWPVNILKWLNKLSVFFCRDLKPQNLLISEVGELKLADFGESHSDVQSYLLI